MSGWSTVVDDDDDVDDDTDDYAVPFFLIFFNLIPLWRKKDGKEETKSAFPYSWAHRFAGCLLQSAGCKLQHAICKLQSAVCTARGD